MEGQIEAAALGVDLGPVLTDPVRLSCVGRQLGEQAVLEAAGDRAVVSLQRTAGPRTRTGARMPCGMDCPRAEGCPSQGAGSSACNCPACTTGWYTPQWVEV